jgi:inner membrane protein
LTGSFQPPSPARFAAWRVAPRDVLWEEAYLALELPSPRGLADRVRLAWSRDGSMEEADFQAGSALLGAFDAQAVGLLEGYAGSAEAIGASAGGIRAPLAGARGGGRFTIDLLLKGGRGLSFLPLGEQTRVRMSSPWPAPRFSGAFLPATRELLSSGFQAEWYMVSLSRGYPQAWRQGEVRPQALQASRFGVELMVPVDTYQKVLRSVKYGILFVLLPFLVFFLFEVFSGRKVHAMQYLLVGFAECLFYLLLLSVSEHLGFGLTYLLAGLLTVALIAFYAGFALGDRRRGLLLAPVLATAYAFLYAALQSEDYALLIGSLGLFVILAGLMILTRKVDWYRPGGRIGGAP